MRLPLRLSLVFGALLVTGAIVPAVLHADNGLRGDRGLPDLWSGIWPANLMNLDGSETPLGTLTWKPIRYEEGVAMIGRDFGMLAGIG